MQVPVFATADCIRQQTISSHHSRGVCRRARRRSGVMGIELVCNQAEPHYPMNQCIKNSHYKSRTTTDLVGTTVAKNIQKKKPLYCW